MGSGTRGHALKVRVQCPLFVSWCNNDKAEFQRSSDQTLEQKTLNSWVRDIRFKQSPAVIFNSTMVEPGERMTFSTSMFSRPHPDQRDFLTVYPDKDISIPTAVRLSATFPVVSPADLFGGHDLTQNDGSAG